MNTAFLPYSPDFHFLGERGGSSCFALMSIFWASLNFSFSRTFSLAWHMKEWKIRTFNAATIALVTPQTIQPTAVSGIFHASPIVEPNMGRKAREIKEIIPIIK